MSIGLALLGGYGGAGLVCAGAAQLWWLGRLDAGASGASWGFRMVVTPGLVGLWPVVLWKAWGLWRGRAAAGRPDGPVGPGALRRAHGVLVLLLAMLAPLVAGAGLYLRPSDALGDSLRIPAEPGSGDAEGLAAAEIRRLSSMPSSALPAIVED